MALEVLIQKNSYTGDKLHLIKKKFWGGATESKLISLRIQFFCESEDFDRSPTKFRPINFEVYKKESHRAKLCEKCVQEVQNSSKK